MGKLEQKHRGAKGALDEELRTFEVSCIPRFAGGPLLKLLALIERHGRSRRCVTCHRRLGGVLCMVESTRASCVVTHHSVSLLQARVAELRAEVVNLRGAAAGGGVAASEARIRELAAQLDDTKLCAAQPMSCLRPCFLCPLTSHHGAAGNLQPKGLVIFGLPHCSECLTHCGRALCTNRCADCACKEADCVR